MPKCHVKSLKKFLTFFKLIDIGTDSFTSYYFGVIKKNFRCMNGFPLEKPGTFTVVHLAHEKKCSLSSRKTYYMQLLLK